MINKRIEVVTADTTGMKETAFGSVETSRGICEILKSRYADVTFNVVRSVQDLRDIAKRKPDLAVTCVKYIFDERSGSPVWLSEFFAEHSIAYTGSNRATLQYDSDKSAAKRLVLKRGLTTAGFFMATPRTYTSEDQLPLPFPLFVKPMDAANGNGIDENSLVHDFASYVSRVEAVYLTYGVPVLVEEYLSGREFTVAVLDDPSENCRLISPIEIIVPLNSKGDRVLGYREKSLNNEMLAVVTEPELSRISKFADRVFLALGVQDFGRVDIKMDENGIPHFMEANLVPGMTPGTSYFPRACKSNYGMAYEAVVLRIAELALFRTDTLANTPPTDSIDGETPVEPIAA